MKSDGGVIRLIVAQESGRNAWYVVELFSSNYQEYKKIRGKNNINLSRFGEILESGWGDITSNLEKDLRQKYKLLN